MIRSICLPKTTLLLAVLFLTSMIQSAPLPVNVSQHSISQEIGPEGGTINIDLDDEGNFANLVIPDGALREKTKITLRIAEKQLVVPMSKPLIRGIIIEPQGLLLDKEAELQIGSPVEITEKTMAYSIENATLVIPIADQKTEPENYVIIGNIYTFGSFCISNPTKQETITQSARLKVYNFGVTKQTSAVSKTQDNSLAFLQTTKRYESDFYYPYFDFHAVTGDCLSWQNTVKKVSGHLGWETYHRMNNDNQLGDNEKQNAKDALQDAIDDFLEKPVPDNPCAGYINAASKYLESSILLGLDNEGSKSKLNQRFSEAVDKCSFRFTVELREWINKPSYTDEQGVSYEEKLTKYGTLQCYLPWGHFLTTGEGKIQGNGTINVNYENHWDADFKYGHKTINGTIEVYNVEGNLNLFVDEHGIQHKTANVTFFLKNHLNSRAWGKPGEDDEPYDWTGEDTQTSKMPFSCTVENGYTSKIGDERAGMAYTVYLIKAPGDGRVNPDDCY